MNISEKDMDELKHLVANSGYDQSTAVKMGELDLPEIEETPDDMKLWCEECTWVGVGLDTKANPGYCPQCKNFWSLTQGEKPSGYEETKKLLNTTDAKVWAESFCNIFKDKKPDVEDMISWFSNAMVTAEDMLTRKLNIKAQEDAQLPVEVPSANT